MPIIVYTDDTGTKYKRYFNLNYLANCSLQYSNDEKDPDRISFINFPTVIGDEGRTWIEAHGNDDMLKWVEMAQEMASKKELANEAIRNVKLADIVKKKEARQRTVVSDEWEGLQEGF